MTNIVSSDFSLLVDKSSECEYDLKVNPDKISFSLFTQDSPTVDFSGFGNLLSRLTASVKLSSDVRNILTVDNGGGLLAVLPPPETINDQYVKLNSVDPTSGYLVDKLQNGTGINFALVNNKLVISSAGATTVSTVPTNTTTAIGDGSSDSPLGINVKISTTTGNIITSNSTGIFAPQQITGTINTIPKFVTANTLGDSLIKENNGRIDMPIITASNVNNTTYPYASTAVNTQTISTTQDLLGGWNQLVLTGSNITQTVEHILAGTFSIMYLQNTGNVTLLGRQHSGLQGSSVFSASNGATVTSPMMSSICSTMGFTDNGQYNEIAGVYIDRPGIVTYAGRPSFSGHINKYYGLYISGSTEGGVLSSQITSKYGIFQSSSLDVNHFAAFSLFGASDVEPTSQVDINSVTGYDQLRLRRQYTPTGGSDPNGNVGEVTFDETHGYYKSTTGWKSWNLTPLA